MRRARIAAVVVATLLLAVLVAGEAVVATSMNPCVVTTRTAC